MREIAAAKTGVGNWGGEERADESDLDVSLSIWAGNRSSH